MTTVEDPLATRTACVVVGVAPDAVTQLAQSDVITVRANKLGALITGKPGGLVIDLAAELSGPVYDIMYCARTGWFAVTVYRGLGGAVRWDNRPSTYPGYPRVDDILGARDPLAILAALDVPAAALGYAPA